MLEPSVIRCVPVREACSAIVREDARDVGGLGGVGIVDTRLEDILAILEDITYD